MKIKITENTKQAFYMSEMDNITKAEAAMKESGGITKEDIQMLANFIGASEVLKAEAEYAKNCKVWEQFGEGSGRVDVWVEITAFDGWKTFYIIGAYISDIWQIGGMDSNELKQRMYIRKFKEA